ncbi:MAG: response regulator [Sporomusa sp.]|jgi:YesN/AraC family two-component response regulator|nr:response regulator [Sporomusa sp.]
MAKVLIVDDSAVVRKGLREIMSSLGHVVVGEAANGIQAFVAYSERKPDIVTMDLTMEGMSGAEATSKIIATYPNARIVVISAIEERPVIIDCLERGARHFIIKPITKDKVSTVLNNVMQQKFDYQKHMDLVAKLKGGDLQTANYDPPYQISVQAGNMILIKINENFSAISGRSFAVELEDHVAGEPRVLLDFGITQSLEVAPLKIIDKIIEKIHAQACDVKAITRNQEFFNTIDRAEGAPVTYLRAVLRYMAS